jgi:hypothetical protein
LLKFTLLLIDKHLLLEQLLLELLPIIVIFCFLPPSIDCVEVDSLPGRTGLRGRSRRRGWRRLKSVGRGIALQDGIAVRAVRPHFSAGGALILRSRTCGIERGQEQEAT